MFAASCLASCLAAAGSFAQQAPDGADPFAGVEEMVVTGSGTAELLNPSSTSAIAFDTKELADIGIQDVGDLDAYVPNLEISSVNATNASFFVRGVGLQDFGANASSSVPIFQDGVPRNPSATQLVGLFDIGGLSVQKGPQGSGAYRNASAGAFVVQTAMPEADYAGNATITYARIPSVDARDANRYKFEAASNMPIYEDIVSARVAMRYSHENPFWENGCANRIPFNQRQVNATLCGEQIRQGSPISEVSPFLRRYLGEVDDFGVRGSLRIRPPDTGIDWVFRFETSRLNRDSTTGQHIGTGGQRSPTGGGTQGGIAGGGDRKSYRDPDITARFNEIAALVLAEFPTLRPRDRSRITQLRVEQELHKDPLDHHPYRGDLDDPGRTLLDTLTFSTTGTMEFDAFETKIHFGYIDYRKSEARDTDLSPNASLGSSGDDQAWEYYGNIEFSGDSIAEIPLEWDAGVYSLTEQVEAFTNQNLSGDAQLNRFTQEIYSFGVYAEGSYELLEAFTVRAGFRYNWERKDFEVANSSILQGGTVFVPPVGSDNQRTWDAGTGYLTFEYAFTEEITSFVKYSRGFKAGHFNPSDAQNAKEPGRGFADPEQIDAVEWGLAATTFGGRLTTNLGFFFYNYRDYQVFRLTTNPLGVFRVVENSEQARNFGAELDLVATPLEGFVPEAVEGLRMQIRAGWLEAEFVEFTVKELRPFEAGNIPVSVDYSGNPLISAPQLTASGIFTWPLVSERFGTLTPQYDFSWTDDVPLDPNKGQGEQLFNGNDVFPSFMIGNRAYTLHNIRLSWVPPGNSGIEIGGWCRNLTDQRYKTFAIDISTFTQQHLVYVADPRVCGADFRMTW